MNNRMTTSDVLLCKLDGNRLKVMAFSHNGETVARRLRLEWNGGAFETSFGCEEFKSERDLENCMKDKLIPFLKGLLHGLVSALSTANIYASRVPMVVEEEITEGTSSVTFSRPVEQ